MPTIWGNNLVVCLINIQYMGAMTTIYISSVKMGLVHLSCQIVASISDRGSMQLLRKGATPSFGSLFKMGTNIRPSPLYGSNTTPQMSTFHRIHRLRLILLLSRWTSYNSATESENSQNKSKEDRNPVHRN